MNERTQQATRIIAVRHGETAWNADARIQGHQDVPLNATGQRQARRLGEALADENPAAIYSSDLRRAMQTAEAVVRTTGAPLIAAPGLRERGFGAFEGRTFEDVQTHAPEHARRWRQRDPDYAPEGGGESLTALRARVLRTVDELAARHEGELIVLVAHGGVMDVLYRLATHQGLQAPRTWVLANAAINRLLWSRASGLALIGWGDTGHLAERGRDELHG